MWQRSGPTCCPPGSAPGWTTGFPIVGRLLRSSRSRYPDLAPRDGFYLTEFFKSSLARTATVGTPQDSLPTERVAVRPDGSVRLESGEPLVADLVLAQHGVELEGRSVAEGTAARLTLWDTAGGPVLLVGVASAAELVAAACGRG